MNEADTLLADRMVQVSNSSGVLDESASSDHRRGQPEPRETPSWLEDAKKHITSLKSLQENWDGYGAAAPDPAILASAASFLASYVVEAGIPVPAISPTRTGGVLFEWENGPHEIEVQLVSRSAASYAYLNTETDCEQSGALSPKDPDPNFDRLMDLYFAS